MKNKKDTQSRKWQITINNPQEKGFAHDRKTGIGRVQSHALLLYGGRNGRNLRHADISTTVNTYGHLGIRDRANTGNQLCKILAPEAVEASAH